MAIVKCKLFGNVCASQDQLLTTHTALLLFINWIPFQINSSFNSKLDSVFLIVYFLSFAKRKSSFHLSVQNLWISSRMKQFGIKSASENGDLVRESASQSVSWFLVSMSSEQCSVKAKTKTLVTRPSILCVTHQMSRKMRIFQVDWTVPFWMIYYKWYLMVLGQYMTILAGTWSV